MVQTQNLLIILWVSVSNPLNLWTAMAAAGNTHRHPQQNHRISTGFFHTCGKGVYMQVKSAATISAKWATRAQAATPDYTAGVSNPSVDWAGPTAASAGNWAQGVQAAAANGSFEDGVTAAGNSTWAAGAKTKGSQRYGQGVAGATAKYQTNFAPYLAVLSALTLPARFPKGSPSNAARSQAVSTALRAAKVGK